MPRAYSDKHDLVDLAQPALPYRHDHRLARAVPVTRDGGEAEGVGGLADAGGGHVTRLQPLLVGLAEVGKNLLRACGAAGSRTSPPWQTNATSNPSSARNNASASVSRSCGTWKREMNPSGATCVCRAEGTYPRLAGDRGEEHRGRDHPIGLERQLVQPNRPSYARRRLDLLVDLQSVRPRVALRRIVGRPEGQSGVRCAP